MASAGRPFGLRNFRETPAAGLAFACLLSAVAFGALVGSAVLLHPRSAAVGHNPSSDYQIMTWSLAWWPWAIRHGVDPTYTHLLWAPGGFSTLWMTTIPTASLLAVPITLTAGPLAAFNLLMILATVLATAAGYLLCRELTGRNAPSVLGGLIFGLSPYMLGHSLSQHLNLVLVFPLPLLVLLVVRHARGRTSSTRLVSGFAASLIVLLGASLELFVDFTVLAVVVFTIAIAAGGSQRRAFLRIASLVGTGYGICLPILLPIGLVALSQPHAPLRSSPSDYATDLLNILVPTSTLAIGAVHSTREVSRHFVGNIGERDGYLGLPLLVVSAAAVRLAWRRGAWILGAAMLAALLLSLGPYLTVAGRPIVHFPVSLASLPLLRDALPGRFSLFTSLAAACLCAIWLAAPHRRGAKPIVVVLLVASLVPNFWSGSAVPGAWAISNVVSWSTPHISRGFLTRGWSSRIKPGSNVLVLPTGDRSSASFWQAISGMRFTLAFPATPFVPPALAADPVVARLADDALPQLDGADVGGARLRAFLLSRDIRTVVVTPPARARWSRLVARATRSQPFALGDVQVYHLPRVLPPLSAEGALSETGAGGSHVAAWLRFDGYRARLLACVWTAARPLGVVAVLSTPAADAEGSADAINAQGKAAVAFTEWRAPRLLLRVASYTRSSWSVATLDQRSAPIWSARVVVTSNGTTVAAWIDQSNPVRRLLVAARAPNGSWTAPRTLDAADGLYSVGVAAGHDDRVVVAWHDSIANDERVRGAIYDHSSWSRPTTLASGTERLDHVVVGGDAAFVGWRTHHGSPGTIEFMQDARNGSSWGRPAEERRRYRPSRRPAAADLGGDALSQRSFSTAYSRRTCGRRSQAR